MSVTGHRPAAGTTAGTVHDPAVIDRLDRALLGMRRTIVRPEITCVPIPALQRTLDLAKVMACVVIADRQDPAGQPASAVKDIAADLGLEHSTASRLLAETEAEGLIVRTSDPADRRRTLVGLTETGRAVVRQSATIRTWAMDQLLAEWTTAELAEFARLTEKFGATFDARSAQVLAAAIERFRE